MTTLATDFFNRANEDPLGNGVWSTLTGSNKWVLTSNVAVPALFSGDCEMLYSGISWPADQYCEANLTVNGTVGGGSGVGLTLRAASGAATDYRLVADHAASNNVEIGKRVAGTFTSLVQFTQAWTDGDLWRFEAVGGVLRVYYKGTLVQSISDSAIASGSPGVAYSSTETSASLDNWVGGTPDALKSFDASLFPVQKISDAYLGAH